MAGRPSLTEVCERINVHLKRLEADPEWNVLRVFDEKSMEWRESNDEKTGTRVLYDAYAMRFGNRAGLRYVGYQHAAMLHRDAAERYLAWLDAGGKGTHYKAFREMDSRGVDTPRRSKR